MGSSPDVTGMGGDRGGQSQTESEDAGVVERYRAFVDSTTDIFTHIRPDGEMASVTSTEEMLGRSRQEFLETPLEEFLHPDDEERCIERFEAALAGEATRPVEARFRHGDGHWIWIETSMSPIPAEYDVDGVVTVTREITDRKRRERDLEEAHAELEQSNEALRRQNSRLDRLASVVSHDLRNPLNVASGRLELIREERDGEDLAAVGEALDRMSRMIDELQTLTLSQRHAENTTTVPIARRARTAWETTETAGGELDVLLDDDVEHEADPELLDHVFENLFRNAVVHNRAPVTVTVGALAERRGFYVADDGTGIPPEHADDVFEYGYTAGGEGTGFGLGIVTEFVEAHGWAVAVTESDGGGARFEIRVD
jgi:PAS domain S-box-containing protein